MGVPSIEAVAKWVDLIIPFKPPYPTFPLGSNGRVLPVTTIVGVDMQSKLVSSNRRFTESRMTKRPERFICELCKRPVERVEQRDNNERQSIDFIFECHGRTAGFSVSRKSLMVYGEDVLRECRPFASDADKLAEASVVAALTPKITYVSQQVTTRRIRL